MVKYSEFVKEQKPVFRRLRNGRVEMFSECTKYVVGDTVSELLNIGADMFEKFKIKE